MNLSNRSIFQFATLFAACISYSQKAPVNAGQEEPVRVGQEESVRAGQEASVSASRKEPARLAQTAPATIGIVLSDSSSKGFQYIDRYGDSRSVRFENPSTEDSLIVRSIELVKPTHFTSRNIYIIPDESPIRDYNSMLVLPGERFAREKGEFLDQVFSLTPDDYDGGRIPDMLPIAGFSKTIDTILLQYEAIRKKIDSLDLKEERRKALHDFNYILYARNLTSIPFEKLSQVDAGTLDGYYDDVMKNHKRLERISSRFTSSVYSSLIQWNAHRNGATSNDFWEYFDKVDSTIHTAPFYASSVQRVLKYIEKYEPNRYAALAEKVRLQGIEVVPSDRGRKTPAAYGVIPDQELFRLQTSDNEAVILTDLLEESKGKLILVDFWASWCVPCRIEIPHFEKMKEEFADRPVEFISISIDMDDKFDAWVKAMEDEGIIGQRHQYRFMDPKDSSFPEFIQMQTIPRYMLIDDKGKVLNADFVRPSDGTFVYELNRALDQAGL